MTVTKEDLKEVEGRFEAAIGQFANSLNELTKQLAEQTNQITKLCASIEHSQDRFSRLEKVQIEQGKVVSELHGDMIEVKTKMDGGGSFVKGVIYPILVVALVGYLAFKG